jgi:competence protein ComEC
MERIGLLPFFKLTIAWILGTLTQFHFLNLSKGESLILLLVVILGSGAFTWFKVVLSPSKFWIKGFSLLLLVFAAAIAVSSSINEYNKADHILNNEYDWALIEIAMPPISKAKSTKVKAKVISIKDSTAWQKASGEMICYFLDSASNLQKGARLILKASCIQEVKPPTNPEQFNYKKYLANKGIYHQAFIRKNDFYLTNHEPDFSIISVFENSRKWMLKNLEFLDTRSKPVAEALLLGYKENLTEDVRRVFSSTGTMHILAVSGLHVGIIYKAVDWLLFFLVGFKHGKKIKIILLLSVLWSYALITGLPPSVIRASLMFSLVTIGISLNRPNNIFNNVFASAFVILVINPRLIYDVGFQLSYSAVLGILVFRPFFSKLWFAPNKVLKFFWDLLTVSFAAQLAVAPISIYYFHQLPLIFPISNLIAIPGAFLVVLLGGFLQLANLISYSIAHLIEVIYEAILSVMITGIEFLSNFPWANLSHLKIDAYVLFLLSLLVFAFAFILIYKSKKAVFAGLGIILTIIFYNGFQSLFNKPQLEWVLFDNYKTCAIGVKSQTSAQIIFFNDKADIGFQSEGWFIENRNIDTVLAKDNFEGDHIKKHDEVLAIGNDLIAFNSKIYSPEIDFYIFSNGFYFKNLKKYNPKKCIFDSSVKPEWVLNNNPTFAQAHFVQRDGAFVNKIE